MVTKKSLIKENEKLAEITSSSLCRGDKLLEERDVLRADNKRLASELARTNHENRNFMNAIIDLQSTIRTLRARQHVMVDVDGEILDAETGIAHVFVDVDALRKENEQPNRQLIETTAKLLREKDNVKTLRIIIGDLKSNIVDIIKASDRKDEIIKHQKNCITDRYKDIKKLKEELRCANANNTEFLRSRINFAEDFIKAGNLNDLYELVICKLVECEDPDFSIKED